MKNKKQKTTFPKEIVRYLLLSIGSGMLLFFILFIGNDFLYHEVIRPQAEVIELAEAKEDFQNFVDSEQADSRARFTWQSSNGTVFYLHNESQDRTEPNFQSDEPADIDDRQRLGTENTVLIVYEDAEVETTFLVVENRRPLYIGIVLSILLALGLIILLFYRQLIKKAKYMNEIEKGTFILESGQLNYRIPEYGNDELTQIAHSINEMSQSLSEKSASEAKATQASREIIGDLSHDIRTPLTILTGYVPVLLETELTQEQRKYLELIDKKTKQMNTRVNDLLEHATIFSGQQPLDLETVDIRLLIEQFATELSPVTNVQLTMDIPPKTLLVGDIKLLERLFDNLVSNVHQHADLEKGVFIQANVKDAMVQMTIQNDCSLNDAGMGKSLGLKISAMIVELHNGVMTTKSEQNKYTSMIQFPLKRK